MVIFIVFLLLMNLAKGSVSSNDISERMSYFLTKLCPRSNICRGNLSSNIDSSWSCCTDCSCAPDCGNTGKCCIANNNHTVRKNVDGISSRTDDVRNQCLYPVSGELEQTDFKNFRSYHMISTIVRNATHDQVEACGNITVGPWGSLFPMFSKQANAIYKNELCAKMDNITDGVLWEAIIKCKVNKPENLQVHLERGLLPKECRVQFRYTGEFKDIEHLICYRDMIDVCTTTEFNVPTSINATKYDITEACQGGLVSPYYGNQHSLYANVFCHICSGSDFYENHFCSIFQDHKGPSASSDGIFGLLNIDALKSLQDAQTTGVPISAKISTVCPTNTEQKSFYCRPVLCPSGQMRSGQGRCVFLIQQWYPQNIQLFLELNSEREFEMTETFDWKKGEITHNIESLSMPSSFKLRAWIVRMAFFKVKNSNSETNTTCLLLYMSRPFSSASPINIIENIGLLTTANWSLRIDNKTLILKPSLFNIHYPDLTPNTSHFKENETLTIQRPVYHIFYMNLLQRVSEDAIAITKLYTCEQIELRTSEYYLSEDRITLYNRIAKQYLFNGEFAVLSDFPEETIRICLEGSGFVKSNAANCAAMAAITASVAAFVVFSALKILLTSGGGG